MNQDHCEPDNAQQVFEVPVDKIDISENNVRKHSATIDLQELADSIRMQGQLQPIVLRGNIQDPRHDVIIGQRRFLAIRDILKKKTIKAIFAGKISDLDVSIRSLAENMMRTELTYEDSADAVTSLYKHFNRDDRRVHKETGMSLKKIRQLIYIEERASNKTKRRLREGDVRPADVQRALKAASGNITKADELLELMKKHSLDKPQKDRMVDYGQTYPRASAEEIIKKALPPSIERMILVRLPERARVGLKTASDIMKMTPDEVAGLAVEEWLLSKGFLN